MMRKQDLPLICITYWTPLRISYGNCM